MTAPPFAQLDGFFSDQLGAPAHAARVLHHALTRSIACCPHDQAIRRPSMCHDGTPVVYSVKLGASVRDAYRLLVEPGSLGHGVGRQVARSLSIADRVLEQLGWQAAVPVINTVAGCVFAGQEAVVERWWGGVWLGASIPSDGGDRPELRLYLNLRNGPACDRWQRLAALFRRLECGDGSGRACAWIDAMMPAATPVGLAMVVSDGCVRGLRVYTVIHFDALGRLALAARAPDRHRALLQRFCTGFAQRFGAIERMTVGTDFALSGRGLEASVARIKVDLCCQLIAAERRSGVQHWVEEQLAALRIDARPLRRFVDRLRAHWHHADIEFVGLAVKDGMPEVTVYAKPAF